MLKKVAIVSVCIGHQVEQQEAIMTQLQQELKAERSRHQDTVQRLQQAKKNISELQEEMEQQQTSLRELNSKVGTTTEPVFAICSSRCTLLGLKITSECVEVFVIAFTFTNFK